MLSAKKMKELLEPLHKGLNARGEIGEIGLVGGAVMCLVYNARAATKDVDGIFEPSATLRQLAAEIAERESLPYYWLNDAAKGYLVPGFNKENVLVLSNLRVWAPDARYMLAMKCISARWDTSDRDDVIFLIKFLKLTSEKDVFAIIENYYPKKQILPKTQFLLEELFENLSLKTKE